MKKKKQNVQKRERKQNIARGCRRAILTFFFKHRQAKMRGDLIGNALMDFTHLFDKMLFFL